MMSREWRIAHWTYMVLLMILLPIRALTYVLACRPVQTFFTLHAVANVPDPRNIKCRTKPRSVWLRVRCFNHRLTFVAHADNHNSLASIALEPQAPINFYLFRPQSHLIHCQHHEGCPIPETRS